MANYKKQMEMFELGGLKDQGETTDRKSRNKVPVGSLKKEVRDDVPINISEGEFVLPADVVRYHGLEKIMNMRQNAKSGLELMNKMGQMGNSDQATLPDTIPFQPQNYQEGGAVVNPQIQMPDVQQQNQVPGVNFTPPQQLGMRPSVYSFKPPQPAQVTTPAAPTYSTVGAPQYKPPTSGAATPDYSKLVGAQFGQLPKSETKRYFNKETGEELYIPFVDGKPVYPIPAGFKEQAEIEEEEKEKDPTKSTVDTAKVIEDSGDDGGFTEPDTPEYRIASTLASQKGGVISDFVGNIFKAGPIGIVMDKLGDKLGKDAAGETFGSVAGMFPTEIDQAPDAKTGQEAQLNTLSRQAGYESYADLANSLGVAKPTFDFGTTTGTISRDTGRFFDDTGGSANWDTGQVAYQSFSDFAASMKASSKSGWDGGIGYSKKDYDKMNTTQQQNYINHLNIMGKDTSHLDGKTKSKDPSAKLDVNVIKENKEKRDMQQRIKEAEAKAAEEKRQKVIEANLKAAAEAKKAKQLALQRRLAVEAANRARGEGSTSDRGGLDDSSRDYDTSSYDSNDSDSSYGDTDADVGGWTASGGFINKRTLTKSKMPPNKKQGGLASRR